MSAPNDYLKAQKLTSILEAKKTPLVSCDIQDRLPVAFQKLVDNKILAMPVFDIYNKEFKGLIGLLEIVDYISNLHWELLLESIPYREADMYVRFNDAVVADLVTPGHVKVQSTSNLAVVAQTLASSEYRRLPVIDDKGEVVHVITFTEVVNLLHQGLGSISSDFLSKKVSSLPHLKDALAKSETHDSKVDLFDVTGVVCVNEVAKTIEAFRLIIGTNVSAVPITNKENKLIGSVAVRDIRAIANNATDIRVLYDETTGEFIKRSIAPLDSLSVSLEEPLSAVIEKLYASRIHRVWVVRDGSIIGAVTLKDVLNEMVGHVQHPHH